MSDSNREIFLLVIILIITSVFYIMGLHQLEPYLDQLYKIIVIDISALFLLLYYRYLKYKTSEWFWNVVRKIKENYLIWKLSRAIKEDNLEEMKKLFLDNAIQNLKSNDQEKIFIGKQQLDELFKKGSIHKKFSILWIEYEANKLVALVKPLVEDGNEITIARNEKEALLKLENNKFDLIILDLIIPTGEKGGVQLKDYVGVHLLETVLIKMKISTPVIVFSVLRSPDITKKVMDMGVKKFLIKGDFPAGAFAKEVYQTLGITK